jgi:chromosome segregation ATPase
LQPKGVNAMLKKLAFLAVIVVGGVVLLNTRYGSVAWKKVKSTVEQQVTPEAKLEMIRDQVSKLDKDLRRNISAVAEQTVSVENLREEIQVAEKDHQKQWDKILVMKRDVESGNANVSLAGAKISIDRIKNKLTRDWDSYKLAEDALKSKRKLLEAKDRSLEAAKERLSTIKTKKEQLALAVEQLEADLKNIRLAQDKSEFGFDDSRIGQIQQQIREVNDWIKGRIVENDLLGKYTADPLPVEKQIPATSEVLKEIDAHAKEAGTFSDDKLAEK